MFSYEVKVQEAMDNLAEQQNEILGRLERIGMAECGPVANEEQDAQRWFDQPATPRPPLENEKPQGETVSYDELLQAWAEGGAQ